MALSTSPIIFSLPLENNVKQIDALQLTHLQNELDKTQIGIDCVNAHYIKNNNSFIQDSINGYLDFIRDRTLDNGKSWYEIRKNLFDKCSIISFDQLQTGLVACTQKLNELLNNVPYTVLFSPQTSWEWTATLALPHMQSPPRSSLITGTDTHIVDSEIPSWLEKRSLTLSDRHIVIFDDVSYTGSQMQKMLYRIQEQVKGVFGHEKISLYIAIPFVSSIALETIQKSCRTSSINRNLDVYLITTNHKPIAMKDVLSQEEIADLIAIEDLESGEGQGDKVYKEKGVANKCLTITAWKIPDTQSIPSSIQKFKLDDAQLPFVSDFKPPYKKEKKETDPFWS